MNKLLKEEFSFADEILKGYTALVCGASKGIGKATAQMLSRAGARVILCARSKLELNEVVSELHGEGHKILVMDLEDIEAIEENILTLIGEVGDIQILINNSGGPPGGPLIENDINFQNIDLISLFLGFFSAFFTGLLACKWMISLVKKSKLLYALSLYY